MPLKYELCARYISEMSPWTDARIVLATIWSVVIPSGQNPLIDRAIAGRLSAEGAIGNDEPPSARAPDAALPSRNFLAWRFVHALRAGLHALAGSFGPLARKVMSLSALTAAGQASFVIALPVLSRLYTPPDFGLFTIYLSIVNIGGPLIGLKFESALYAARTQEEAGASLSLVTMIVMSSAMAIALFVFALELTGR
jgi:hypothetical protein